MTERTQEHIETPERTHDQPAEGGREQADQATEDTTREDDAERTTGERVE